MRRDGFGGEGVAVQPKIMAAAMPPCTKAALATTAATDVDDDGVGAGETYHANEGRKLGAQLRLGHLVGLGNSVYDETGSMQRSGTDTQIFRAKATRRSQRLSAGSVMRERQTATGNGQPALAQLGGCEAAKSPNQRPAAQRQVLSRADSRASNDGLRKPSPCFCTPPFWSAESRR